MVKRHFRPVEGQDPLIDFIDDILRAIEDMRYSLKVMKSELLVIRKVNIQLLEEHNNYVATTDSTDSGIVPDL